MLQKKDKKLRFSFRDFVSVLRFVKMLSAKYLVIAGFYTIIDTLAPFINLFFMSIIIDQLVQKSTPGEIFNIVIVMILLNVLINITRALLNKSKKVEERYLEDKTKERIVKTAVSLPYEILEKKETQELLRTAEEGCKSNGGIQSLCNDIYSAIGGVILFVYSLIVCSNLFLIKQDIHIEDGMGILINSPLGLCLIVCIFGIAIWVICRNIKKVGAIQKDFFEQNVMANNKFGYFRRFVYEYNIGKDIRLYNMQNMILENLKESDQGVKKVETIIQNKRIRCNQISIILNTVIQLVIYIFVALKAIYGIITIGQISFYVSTILAVFNHVNSMTSAITWIPIKCDYIKKYLDFVGLDKEDGETDTLNIQSPIQIEFCHVDFSYPDSSELVLKDINIVLNAGDVVAVVGRNGAGKSTFIKLLCGLYRPVSGTILVNGVDIQSISKEEYYKLLSAVFQDYKLYAFLLGQNIAANQDFNADEVMNLCDEVNIGNIVSNLKEGLNTYLYNYMEKGVELSGGQMQKVAIARAFYKKGKINIFDEPSSALDSKTENEVYEKIMSHGGTDQLTLFVSHRMSSCQLSNRIVVFKDGRIIQQGRHAQLVNENGEYKDLWTAQAQYY